MSGSNANRRGAGRCCLDEERQKFICAIVAKGMSLRSAAASVGVDEKTISRHTLRDRQFRERLNQARARGEFRLVENIHEAALKRKDWRAAAWLLSVCYRKDYGPVRKGVPNDAVRLIFERLTTTLLSEVHDAEVRGRILARLRNLNALVCGAHGINLLVGRET
jgi:hypothetical protein